MRVGSLFAGIGGFDLGLERAGMETVWQVEIDDYCNKVLEKHWPNVRRYRDVREVGKHNLKPVDLICGGFPCQPFSTAGKQRGKEDNRYLWPEMLRIIKELKPRWVIGENVAGIINMGLDQCLSDLEDEGYTNRTFIIPACAIFAPHRRDRIWIVAWHTNSDIKRTDKKICKRENSKPSRICQKQSKEIMAYSDSGGCLHGQHEKYTTKTGESSQHESTRCDKNRIRSFWTIEPEMDRVVNGISSRLDKDRIKTLGNAVVPQIPEIIGRAIMEIENK